MSYRGNTPTLYSEKFRDTEGVLFDVDWTLITFGEAKRAAVNRAISSMINAGLPLTADEAKLKVYTIYRQTKDIEYQTVFDDLLNGLNLPETVWHKILAAGVNGYRKGKEGALTLYPHTIPTLLELRSRGYVLGAISDAPTKQLWLRLDATGLADYFKTVITPDNDGNKKPHPSLFRRALSELRVRPEQTIMVGDNPAADLLGAKRIGMKTILAKYGLQDASTLDEAEKLVFYSQIQDSNDSDQVPDAEINDIEELLFLLPSHH